MASLDDIKVEPMVDSEIENAENIFCNALQQLAASTSADNGATFSQDDIDALTSMDLDALMMADLDTEEPPLEPDIIDNLISDDVSDMALHVKEEPPDIHQLLQKLDSEIGVNSSDTSKAAPVAPVINFCPSLSSEHVEGLASTSGGGMFSSDEDEPLTPSISQTVAALGLPTSGSSSTTLWTSQDDATSTSNQPATNGDGVSSAISDAATAISDESVLPSAVITSLQSLISSSTTHVQSNSCTTSAQSASGSTVNVSEAPSQSGSQGQFSAALEQLVLNAAAPKTTTKPSWASMPLPLYSGSEAGPDTQVTPSNQSSLSASTKPESVKKIRDGKPSKKRKSDASSNKHDASSTSPAKSSRTVTKSGSDDASPASHLKLTIRLSQHGKLGEVINHQGKEKHSRKHMNSEHKKHSSDKSKKSRSALEAAVQKVSSAQKNAAAGQRTTVQTDAQPLPKASADGGPNPPASGSAFSVDTTLINAVPVNQQDSELQDLGLRVYNAAEFEQGVMAQVDEALAAEEKERRDRIIKKEIKGVQDDLRTTKQELSHIDKVLSMMTPQTVKDDKESKHKMESVRRQKENKIKQLKKLRAKQKMLTAKLHGSADGPDDEDAAALDAEDAASSAMLDAALGHGGSKAETDAERAIRLGEMTPFGTVMNFPESSSKPKKAPPPPKPSIKLGASDFDKYLMDQAKKASVKKKQLKKASSAPDIAGKSVTKESLPNGASHSNKDKLLKVASSPSMQSDKRHKTKGANRFEAKDKRHWYRDETDMSRLAEKRRRVPHARLNHNFSGNSRPDYNNSDEEDDYYHGDGEYMPHPDEIIEEDEDFSDAVIPSPKKKRKSSGVKRKPRVSEQGDPEWSDSGASSGEDLGAIKAQFKVKVREGRDDGSHGQYVQRVKKWKKSRLKEKQRRINNGEAVSDSSDDEAEFDGGLRVPGRIWKNLYMYQKTGVKWLWELHGQEAGGIVGDEMGLGKTIQIIAFLAALRVSKLRDRASKYSGLGPTIIVCPATVMHQWVKEFHKWWPPFRVAVLHSSGSYNTSEADLIYDIVTSNGVVIMSYQSLVIHQDTLLEHDWHYIILDEGHKIRNPDAQATLAAKQFRTCHRLILSGSPVQNNLKELWSLFDFVFPGKLGTLPDFMQHFSVPIVQGGYSTATQVQVTTAYKCACILRDTINPYLLRRMKSDVQCNINLPEKNEQVLFCRLTEEQRDVYEEYLDSKECNMIVSGRFMVFPGLITLRKICNHPDLSTGGPQDFGGGELVNYTAEERDYGWFKRSGKMIVIESLLKLWHKQGHRVLLFSQSKQMLYILENFVMQQNYTYLRMDGGTSISARQPLITKFNEDRSIFMFLLTTHVGGLGVNLTGANRIIIFDPDWNPSTDCQARERAWRIGQTRQVTIYRLLTAGTIEEKIYHRQIFKQFLTNRVLKDPKQRRFFKANDLYELFTLGSDNPESSTETSAIFAGTGSDVTVTPGSFRPKSRKSRGSNRFDEMKERQAREKEEGEQEKEDEEEEEADLLGLTQDRLAELRKMAKSLSEKVKSGSKTKAASKPAGSDSAIPTPEEGEIIEGSESTGVANSPETKGTDTPDETVKVKVEGSPVSSKNNDDDLTPSEVVPSVDTLADSRESTLRELARKLSEKIVSEEGSKDRKSSEKTLSSDASKDQNLNGEATSEGGREDQRLGEDPAFQEGSENQNVGEKTGSEEGTDIQRMSESVVPDEVSKGQKPTEKTVSGEESKDCGSKPNSSRTGASDSVTEPVPSTSRDADSREKSRSHSHRHKKHKKHKKHKRRHNKDVEFEGEKISNLAKVTDYKPGKSDELKMEESGKKDDDYVLQRLFKKTGVHSAMQHDRIMQSSDPDYALVEGEAERVAKEAARALKESRSRCHSASAGVPTWTGQSGVSGAPQEVKPRFGRKKNTNLLPSRPATPTAPSTNKPNKQQEPPEKTKHFDGSLAGVMKAGASSSEASTPNIMTSSELLGKMRARNHLLNAASGEDGAAGPSSHITEQEIDLMADIRNHIAFACAVDGQASTQELLDHFSKVIPAGESAKFKAMLKQLCTFSKRSGTGIWKLRQDFR